MKYLYGFAVLTVLFCSGCYEHSTDRYISRTSDAITIKGKLACRGCKVSLRANNTALTGGPTFFFYAFTGKYSEIYSTYTGTNELSDSPGWYEFSFNNITIPRSNWMDNLFIYKTAELKAYWVNPSTGKEEVISGFEAARHDYGATCLQQAQANGKNGAEYCGLRDTIEIVAGLWSEEYRHCIDDAGRLGFDPGSYCAGYL